MNQAEGGLLIRGPSEAGCIFNHHSRPEHDLSVMKRDHIRRGRIPEKFPMHPPDTSVAEDRRLKAGQGRQRSVRLPQRLSTGGIGRSGHPDQKIAIEGMAFLPIGDLDAKGPHMQVDLSGHKCEATAMFARLRMKWAGR